MGFMTGNGKIARLPRAIRDELNRRMGDGQTGQELLPWLNEFHNGRIYDHPASSAPNPTFATGGVLRFFEGVRVHICQ